MRVQVFHDNIILETMRELSQAHGFKFKSIPEKLYGAIEWDKIDCRLETEDFDASFQLQQCPGCCAVLTLSYIGANPYTQENVNEVIKIVEKATQMAGFGSLMMTQVVPAYSKMLWRDEPWIMCLDRGWMPSDPFRNAKSGNLVVYLTKDLKQPGKRAGLEVRA